LKKNYKSFFFLHVVWKENGNDLPRLVYSRCNIIKSPPCTTIHWGLFNSTKRTSPFLNGAIKNVTPWFSWTHRTLKNHRNTWINIFIIFLMNTFIRLHRFWNFNKLKNIFYFDVPNHCIYKKFQECNISFFSWTFGHEQKFETWFEKFLGNCFKK
jgi:hypothetical protein